MHRLSHLLIGIVMLLSGIVVQIRAQAPADTALYAVSYVEVMPSARAAVVAALRQYRDASRKEDGYVRFDLLEQVGRSGQFVVIETWRDQKAFEAHGMAAHVRPFQDALQPIRLSGYDQRPYKPFTVAPPGPAGNGQAVHVVAHVDIAGGPQAQADALGLLRQLADASRKEQAGVRFDVLQHAMRANHFTVVETWQRMEALEAHRAAQHTRQYRDSVQPMTGSPLDERVYTAVE